MFRNGLVEEGYVVSWSKKESVIRALSSNNLLEIFDTEKDVLAVKIFVEEIPKNIYIDSELETKERDPGLRAKKLAELRIMQGKGERERARELMTTFKPVGIANVEYGIPRKLSRPKSSQVHSSKKNRCSDSLYSRLLSRNKK